MTFNGNGTADASSPANAACAMKLQEVLNAAGQRVTEGNTAIVKIAGYEVILLCIIPIRWLIRTIRRVTRS